MTETKVAQNWKEIGELEEKYDVLAGATSPQAERALREKYPISWPRLLELKVREMQRLLGEVQALAIEARRGDAYQLQRKVNALRKIAVEVGDGLLEFSRELMGAEAHA